MAAGPLAKLSTIWARHELRLGLLLALALLGIWAFIEIADEVFEGETSRFDEWLLLAMRSAADPADPLGPRWLEEMGRDFTALGSLGVLMLVTLAAVGYLLLIGKRHTAALMVAAVVGGWLVSHALKMGFDRPRPDLVPHATWVTTASFPSGHSMMAAITYLTLGVLLARTDRRRRVKTFFLTVALTVTMLVGLSRVYLGVHWPTDVLAGWCAGMAWALLTWAAAGFLQRRGRIEQAGRAQEPGRASSTSG